MQLGLGVQLSMRCCVRLLCTILRLCVLVVCTDGARAAEPGEDYHGVCDTRKGGKLYHVNSATHDDTIVLFSVLQHSCYHLQYSYFTCVVAILCFEQL